MMAYPKDFNASEIAAYQPIEYAAPAQGVFELTLALGGTVSAGAYTAGVLDFLVEAMDAWQAAKNDLGRQIPRHQVYLRGVAGASGGGINGILLGRAFGYSFPHGPVKDNPFFVAWTEVDIEDLLQIGKGESMKALLNTSSIEALAASMVGWTNNAPLPSRPWVSDDLPVYTTISNVTGLPYKLKMAGQSELSHCMRTLADWLRFIVKVPGGSGDDLRAPAINGADDKEILEARKPGVGTTWEKAAKACLATSAFPGAFKARTIERTLGWAGYRFFAVPGDGNAVKTNVYQLVPDWDSLVDQPNGTVYSSINVDGGAANNEPIDIAHSILAGIGGRNPRQALDATRAVILIDPLSDDDGQGLRKDGILDVIPGLLGGLVSQARFKPEDLALAHDPECYSRFLIAPVGRPKPGSQDPVRGTKAIGSGSLGGFGGFFDTALLVHDFKVGRANAKSFLQKHFILDANNPLFTTWKEGGNEPSWSFVDQGDGKTYRPIIPLMKEVSAADMPDAMPMIQDSTMAAVGDAIEKRVDWIYAELKEQLIGNLGGFKGWAGKGYADIGWKLGLRSAVLGKINHWVAKGLGDWGVRPKLEE